MSEKRGSRMTSQRRIVRDVLKGSDSHPTAAEVLESSRKRLPEISLATVYRNLEYLCESGDARRIDFGGEQRHFDGDTSGHYHVRCVKCGHIGDVHVKGSERIEARVQECAGYEIVGHRLSFVGFCPQCGEDGKTRDKVE